MSVNDNSLGKWLPAVGPARAGNGLYVRLRRFRCPCDVGSLTVSVTHREFGHRGLTREPDLAPSPPAVKRLTELLEQGMEEYLHAEPGDGQA